MVVDAYSLAFAGLVLSGGTVGDRYGRRRTLAAGLAVFGVGSAVAAFAGSTDSFLEGLHVGCGVAAGVCIAGALLVAAFLPNQPATLHTVDLAGMETDLAGMETDEASVPVLAARGG
jgi:MFS family permease